MGDANAEPSMEEILSSIKRIIAEEGDAAPRTRRSHVGPAPVPPAVDPASVLELSNRIPLEATPDPQAESDAEAAPDARDRVAVPTKSGTTPEAAAEIVSQTTAQATRGALEALSRLKVKAAPGADGTLEGLVRDMLRPMLREWIDAHLPQMVETLVAREIARITNEQM